MSDGNACPYCRQTDLTDGSRWSLATNLMAKALSLSRAYYEMRGESDFNWRRLGEAFLNEASMPVASEYDRRCPFCRRGFVTRASRESIWLDSGARALGLLRTYFEISGDESRPSLSWRDLATLWVEGDEASAEHVYYSRVEVVPGSTKFEESTKDEEPEDSGKSSWFGGFGR